MGRYDVLGLLSALVDKSLVQVNEKGDHYGLLETIRAYAAQELAASGEEVAARDRHLGFFAELGELAEKGMWTSAAPLWLVVLDAEHDNLRAALDWALASGQLGTGARLVYAIGQFLFIRCYLSEGRRWCEELLAHDLAPARRLELYWWAGPFTWRSDPAAGRGYAQALLGLGRELRDDRAVARGLELVAVSQRLSDPVGALGTLGEALATARAVGLGTTVVDCLAGISNANMVLGRFPEALRWAEEALATVQRIDYAWGTSWATVHVARAALELGELDRAAAAAAALMELAQDLGDQNFTQSAHWVRGIVGMYRSEPSAAQDLVAARQLAERTHNNLGLGGICCDQGRLALALGQDEVGRGVLEEAVPLADAFQSIYSARTRCLLAEAAVRRADLAEARRWLDDALALPLADQLLATRARARLARARGDDHLAWELATGGVDAARRSGAQLFVIDFLEMVALLAADAERYTETGRLLAAAATERARLGYARFPVDQPDVEAATGKVEAALGPSGSEAATSEGAALSVDEAIGYARRGRGERGRPSFGWASLTPTEQRVVGLVVEGMTNAEIGGRMFVSTGTVKSHLNHIYDKLGVTNRRQLVDAARQVAS